MKVKNGKVIRRLSFKTFWASRKRNWIAVFAIALTTLLFTCLFTIALSINSSYETYTFRQIGGYNHGSFKEVNEQQAAALSAHPKVKETGLRKNIGIAASGVFAKTPAEVSYMDENMAKWSYCVPAEGRLPESGKEIAMDTGALALLGIEPKLGSQVTLTWEVDDKNQQFRERTDTFTLVGFWEYDDLSPVHFINISEEYADQVEAEAIAAGLEPFRADLNVMLSSSINIRGVMEQIDTDLGYQWEDRSADNCVRIGVNWGYTASQVGSTIDVTTVLAIVAFVLLVVFTGYLIIYNIFRISVMGDIRFYGLLKTIGTTPKQLSRIIRMQALMLCIVGIPAGMLAGYGIGAVLTPVVLKTTSLGNTARMVSTISTSPLIFIGSALFSLITVLLSCSRPGRIAGRVSPVEATRYTEKGESSAKRRATRGAKVYHMAFANLGRSKSKTALVIVSLSLSVVLLTVLYSFTNGFDMEKYLAQQTCADFIVGKTQYFRYEGNSEDAGLEEETINSIQDGTQRTLEGGGWAVNGFRPTCKVSEEIVRQQLRRYNGEEETNQYIEMNREADGMISSPLNLEGLNESLFEKVTVVEGSLEPLFSPDSHAIAILAGVDDYGNLEEEETYPAIGDVLSVTYIDEYRYIDSRTGEPADDTTPEEYVEERVEASHFVDYTVCALVTIPYSMSFRFASASGYDAVVTKDALSADSGMEIHAMFYLFDTPDEAAEAEAERFLAELTEGELSGLMYESKATKREEFNGFKNMFMLLGGILCFIIGLVGILNFFNAIMTGILARRREFAVLSAIGMTGKQLKSMLVCEGLLYAAGSIAISLVLGVGMGPLIGGLFEKMFWFFSYHFSLLPVFAVAPVFALLGALIPLGVYGSTQKESVVERLREE